MKQNEPLSEKMLTYIAYCVDAVDFVFSYHHVTSTIKHYYGREYQISTLRKEYSVLKSEGLVELKTHYRRPYPVLTQKGRLKIKTQLSYKQYGPWDEKWRLVSFDIPERLRSDRLKLTHELKKIGYVPIQKSTFVSPHPLNSVVGRFATDQGVRQYLRLFEVDKIDNEKETIQRIWDLDAINHRYQHFLAKAGRAKHTKFWGLQAKKLEHEFAFIYAADPHLPTKFLPTNWAGAKAYAEFKKISNSY